MRKYQCDGCGVEATDPAFISHRYHYTGFDVKVDLCITCTKEVQRATQISIDKTIGTLRTKWGRVGQ